MLKHIPGVAALCLLAFTAQAQAAPETVASPRVTALYTTWDDYYFYAAVQVRDPNVIATNTTPTSQPQQDDDVELFFETDHAKAPFRTPHTYQMAVSAANGAYFSVGNNTSAHIPTAEAVYTYKYAAGVDGTLNNSSDTDIGYTVEIAIPWRELGQAGPPKNGTVWGFNAISRDRDSTQQPAQRFYSLSSRVTSGPDVQTPSKWSDIVFDNSGATDATSTTDLVVSPHITSHYPLINGSVVSGEWPSLERVAFGYKAVDSPSPTAAEEPNTTESPFSQLPKEQLTPPPATTTPEQTAQSPNSIALPGGGSIKIVPGGIKSPFPPETQRVTQTVEGSGQNPLTPKLPKGYIPPRENDSSLTGSLSLPAPQPPALIMAIYRVDYNGDTRLGKQTIWDSSGKSLLTDQPVNGAGPWFSGLRPLWHRQQLADLRRAGIDVILLRAQAGDPQLPHELDALAEALKEMKSNRQDYPLVGIDAAGGDPQALETILTHIPAEFRATTVKKEGAPSGVIVLGQDSLVLPQAADGAAITELSPKDGVAYVSPGLSGDYGVVARDNGQTYDQAWTTAEANGAKHIVIESWNDFTAGSEIAASRQYGEDYADRTRLHAIEFNGNKEWRAKYLQEQTPRVISPGVLYQVPIRIENAGTLPWRAGEGYSLSPRWYKDGRLYDDSAPRIPVGVDVFPGQTITLNVGLTARNSYGENLEPGNYTLVFDMVQGQDRWFSYASDIPLQIPVAVLAANAPRPAGAQATFTGTETPAYVQSGAAYQTHVSLRNDDARNWPAGQYFLGYKIQNQNPATKERQTVASSETTPLSAAPVAAGEIVTVPVNLTAAANGKPLPPGHYRLHWYVKSAGGEPATGSYDESLDIVASDPGASFILSDIPRTMAAGKEATALLAVQNLGAHAWSKGSLHIGYHWYYLDGTEEQWDGGPTAPLTKDVPVDGIDGNITAKMRAPQQPGRYILAWDAQTADGAWASVAGAAKGSDLLPVIVTVTGKGNAIPVDLTRLTGGAGAASADNFDGAGHGLPAEMLPPDRTAEVEGNPLLIGKQTEAPYPSGFYAAAAGEGSQSNHRVIFQYPSHRLHPAALLVCQGQQVPLPGGSYRAIHLLAAATGGSTVNAAFMVNSQSNALTAAISDWGSTPAGPGCLPAWQSPYRTGKDGDTPQPAILGDYTLLLDPSRRTESLTLPNSPAIKILAITLEK